jgi:hypothetical protein
MLPGLGLVGIDELQALAKDDLEAVRHGSNADRHRPARVR